MSKIGRTAIPLTGVTVTVNGSHISIKGAKKEVTHELPSELSATVANGALKLTLHDGVEERHGKTLWGLHRALIANEIKGLGVGFKRTLKIVGLGFKAQKQGDSLVLTLGYSHKIEYTMPKTVSVEIDKTGQLMTFASQDKLALGNVCAAVRAFRLPEPYKGTGIMFEDEQLIRKAGKAKA